LATSGAAAGFAFRAPRSLATIDAEFGGETIDRGRRVGAARDGVSARRRVRGHLTGRAGGRREAAFAEVARLSVGNEVGAGQPADREQLLERIRASCAGFLGETSWRRRGAVWQRIERVAGAEPAAAMAPPDRRHRRCEAAAQEGRVHEAA
jgi:hypothetical protein